MCSVSVASFFLPWEKKIYPDCFCDMDSSCWCCMWVGFSCNSRYLDNRHLVLWTEKKLLQDIGKHHEKLSVSSAPGTWSGDGWVRQACRYALSMYCWGESRLVWRGKKEVSQTSHLSLWSHTRFWLSRSFLLPCIFYFTYLIVRIL